MPKRPPQKDRTVFEQFAWSYAIMTMVYASRRHGGSEYKQTDHIVRNKNYHGILKGKLSIGSLLVDEPLALILQREHINEEKPGEYIHVTDEHTTEWPVEFLSHPPRTDSTIHVFLSPDAPVNRLDILRGMA